MADRIHRSRGLVPLQSAHTVFGPHGARFGARWRNNALKVPVFTSRAGAFRSSSVNPTLQRLANKRCMGVAGVQCALVILHRLSKSLH